MFRLSISRGLKAASLCILTEQRYDTCVAVKNILCFLCFYCNQVKFTGIKSEAPTPYAGFMSYGALNCPDTNYMLIVFMHVMADGEHIHVCIFCCNLLTLLFVGGPDDTGASLKCRVLFSITFPYKNRKRKHVVDAEPHPLAIFEAVSGKVLEQLVKTGMTSKGGKPKLFFAPP